MELREARAQLRRDQKRESYRRRLPLSMHKSNMSVTIWWAAGKLVCMALRYLEMEYLATKTRCGITDEPLACLSPHGDDVVHSPRIPVHWRRTILDQVAALTEDELLALERPQGKQIQLRAKARQFQTEVALVDYVHARNQRGLTVSSRAVLERKGFLLDPAAVHSHARLTKLSRPGLKWIARWQKRHGLSRGRFRQGCGLTLEQQRTKVCPQKN